MQVKGSTAMVAMRGAGPEKGSLPRRGTTGPPRKPRDKGRGVIRDGV